MIRWIKITLMMLAMFECTVHAELLDRIVASVNGQALTLSELNQSVQAFQQSVPTQAHLGVQAIQAQLLDQWIDRQLQLDAARQAGIHISKAEIDAALNRIVQHQDLSLQAWLEKTHQSLEMVQSDLRAQLMIMHVQQEALSDQIEIKASDIKALQRATQRAHSQAHLIDWLWPVDASNFEATRHDAINFANQLRQNGKPPTTSAWIRTDLGRKALDDLPELFSNQIHQVMQDRIMGPIQAPNGWHVLKVVSLHQPATISDDQAHSMLYQKALRKALPGWLKGLRSKAAVEVLL